MYSLSTTEAIIARALDIPKKRRAALSAEIKYLRRRGFPKLPRTGKGSRTEFRPEQIFLLTVAIGLGQLGIQPKVAIKGAELVQEARHRPKALPENPFLCISKYELGIFPGSTMEKMIELQGRATVVDLKGLTKAFQLSLSEEIANGIADGSIAEEIEMLFEMFSK